MGLGGVRQPEQPRRLAPTGRHEQRPHRGVVAQRPVGQSGRGEQRQGSPRRWRWPPPRPSWPSRRSRPRTRSRRRRLPRGRQRCGRRRGGSPRSGWRTVIQAVDIGEQNEGVRGHQVGNQGSEPVVVAEPDLAGRHGVVLVDHRDDPEVQQPVQRAPRVAIVGPPGHILDGEQDLSHGQPVPGKGPLVCRDERPAPRWPRPAGSGGRAGASSGEAG